MNINLQSPNLKKEYGRQCVEKNASESFTYYVINEYVPRVRANADQVLTTYCDSAHHRHLPKTVRMKLSKVDKTIIFLIANY